MGARSWPPRSSAWPLGPSPTTAPWSTCCAHCLHGYGHQYLDDDERLEDYFTIERVEPGVLWLSGGVGPVNVGAAASSLARPGWSVYLVLARSDHPRENGAQHVAHLLQLLHE